MANVLLSLMPQRDRHDRHGRQRSDSAPIYTRLEIASYIPLHPSLKPAGPLRKGSGSSPESVIPFVGFHPITSHYIPSRPVAFKSI